jgi:hypothetical protein
MPEHFGLGGPAVRERIGHLSQIVRAESFVETDGVAHGSRRVRLVNGGGLEIEVHPDRALDVGRVTVDGMPVAWISPTGVTGPEAYEPEGAGWLRTFGGGLLATCGLDAFGPPDEDEGVALGQHGRIGAQRATVTRLDADEHEVVVEGVVRQATVFGEHLELRRRISTASGSRELRIHDVVTNRAFVEQPHMILYHLNFGWPLLGDRTRIELDPRSTTPRDADAAEGAGRFHAFGAPVAGFREQVFIHEYEAGEHVVAVVNPDAGLRAEVRFDGGALPAVFQWKMQGQGHYALGIEPANTPDVFGRSHARATGRLPRLAPGESVAYDVAIRFEREPETAPTAKEKT